MDGSSFLDKHKKYFVCFSFSVQNSWTFVARFFVQNWDPFKGVILSKDAMAP